MPMELWKPIPGYEDLYEISNLGRVKSFRRLKKGSNYKVLKNHLSLGYHTVCLTKNGKTVITKVHRLVAKSFIPNPDNKPEVNHIDMVRNNNHFSNLEWVTRSENIKHAFKNSPDRQKRYNHPMAKLDEVQAETIA